MAQIDPSDAFADEAVLAECVEACIDCALAHAACADACLGESIFKEDYGSCVHEVDGPHVVRVTVPRSGGRADR